MTITRRGSGFAINGTRTEVLKTLNLARRMAEQEGKQVSEADTLYQIAQEMVQEYEGLTEQLVQLENQTLVR